MSEVDRSLDQTIADVGKGSAPAIQIGEAGIQERTQGERPVVRLNPTAEPTSPSSPLADKLKLTPAYGTLACWQRSLAAASLD